MGHKIVCLNCRKAFSTKLGRNHNYGKCQECGSEYVYYNHKFRAPKRTKLKQWQVIRFLYQHGFNYQHINDQYIKLRQYGYYTYAKYPTDMNEAKEFVSRFKPKFISLTV